MVRAVDRFAAHVEGRTVWFAPGDVVPDEVLAVVGNRDLLDGAPGAPAEVEAVEADDSDAVAEAEAAEGEPEDADEAEAESDGLDELSLEELRERAVEAGLPKSGNKSDLIERLLAAAE